MLSPMRLDKFISHASSNSRELSRRAIRARRVTVNGHITRDAALSIAAEDRIELDERVLSLPEARYLMLHKPPGYVCATEDAEHPIVLDLLNDIDTTGLCIAGRLDMDTSGLVLLSDDGQWLHRLTSPPHHVEKTYIATLAERIDEPLLDHFAAGILLHGESKPTLPATCIVLNERKVQVTISEGRYHQLKRMFAACGNRVLALHRNRIGEVFLDETLQPGEYRTLNTAERVSLGV